MSRFPKPMQSLRPHGGHGLTWFSWALQREVTLDDLDEIAAGEPS